MYEVRFLWDFKQLALYIYLTKLCLKEKCFIHAYHLCIKICFK